MARKLNLKKGDIYKRLTLLNKDVKITNNGWKGLWKCECGVEKLYLNSQVMSGHTNSCGCYRNDKRKIANTKHGHSPKGNESPEYGTWQNLKDRCLNINNKDYHHYGGRGITVCDEWKNSFESFLKDMGLKPSNKHSIDRKNNNLGYFKENCNWVLHNDQISNRRNSIRVIYNNETYCLKEVCNLLNLSYGKALSNYNKKQILPENVKKSNI